MFTCKNNSITQLVNIMKKLFLLLSIIIISAACNAQNIDELTEKNSVIDTNKVLTPDALHSDINKMVTRIFSRYHYRKTPLNDSLSALVLDNYLKVLDYNKMYFLKSDVDSFQKYRNNFDEYLIRGDLNPAFEIFNTFKQRLNTRIDYIVNRLKSEFDFTIDEYYEPDRTEMEYASSEEELNDLWRKRLKNESIGRIINGDDWKDISESLTKRYQRYHKTVLQYDEEDVFELYMNAFADVVDPHTNYLSPITSDNFNIGMSLALEGIGARLTIKNDYTTIVEIIPGGPADKSKLLNPEDRIIAVGQGEDGEMIDVIGWRIDDVVQLIRGKKGTTVKLHILKANAAEGDPYEVIKLVRDKVKIEDQAAKAETINIEENGTTVKLGVISIPSFYNDFSGRRTGDQNFKSTTKDVRKILDSLKTENIDGVIIDLRNNGGGSLQEAIELTGLFIEEGPIVQVKQANGAIEVDDDPDPQIVYDGPLAVIINRFSASASEIFAGAIQDYDRGLILGEQTYGKGTVQNLIDLNRFLPSSGDKFGQVKLTIAKFYRITGSSTQHKGVEPDIAFPSAFSADEYGESSKPSALPWDQINPTKFKSYGDIDSVLPELKKEHQRRVKNNIEFQFLVEDINEMNERRERNSYSLNLETRKEEKEVADQKKKLRDEERQESTELTIKGDEEVKKENLKVDDPLLEESGHILADFILAKIG